MPIVAAGRPFLTYKDATRHLQPLTAEAREAVCLEIRENAER